MKTTKCSCFVSPPDLRRPISSAAAGPDLPHQATYIGEQPVRAGATSDLVLVDLDPGTYTIVCLFPDAEGTPHLAQGMEATFRVE